MAKKEEIRVPSAVRVGGVQNPVSVDNKGNISIAEHDPRAPIKTSPFSELLTADDDWINKYGGSDVSILAYNINMILESLMEKTDGKEKDKHKTKNPGKEG